MTSLQPEVPKVTLGLWQPPGGSQAGLPGEGEAVHQGDPTVPVLAPAARARHLQTSHSASRAGLGTGRNQDLHVNGRWIHWPHIALTGAIHSSLAPGASLYPGVTTNCTARVFTEMLPIPATVTLQLNGDMQYH